MPKRCFIITGTSKGIGESLARTLLARGDRVVGISRREAGSLDQCPGYTHVAFDLMQTAGLEPMLQSILGRINPEDLDMIGLVNNAAMLEPLRRIEAIRPEEMEANLRVTLMAPMILTAVFTRETKAWDLRKKAIQVSSGSGSYANPGMSVYSAAKAGLNMFTMCAGTELADSVEVIAIDPGMVDTSLQASARNKSGKEFELAPYFEQAYREGQLTSPDDIAKRIAEIIDAPMKSGSIAHC
ncbi:MULTISPECIES: SDR family NAD(P)-dependent oxidoreductase [Paenibacillus]|uniref:Short-chain dehydrogenase n=1 Tax=Paenibacillus albilobatus TaxID=2716884 RepID=A0A920C9Z7_9BACL|nr:MULTISPECIES: SDR family NAD(P)-dependent oxidoreductase [Paenibacillus]GIO31660.1 short-chain dehydrogenase [Paenibacillus albilobatus]